MKRLALVGVLWLAMGGAANATAAIHRVKLVATDHIKQWKSPKVSAHEIEVNLYRGGRELPWTVHASGSGATYVGQGIMATLRFGTDAHLRLRYIGAAKGLSFTLVYG